MSIRSSAAALVTLALSTALCSAAVVYNNTTTSLNQINPLLAQGQVNSLEHGNQITLAGHERIVTSFNMRMRVTGAGACTFQMRVRFMANDGPGGAPGTQLWNSGYMPRVIDSGADFTYSLPVPNVRVPLTFTWSVQVIDRAVNMAPMGPAEYSPPTVGSAMLGYWRNSGLPIPDWTLVNAGVEPPFSATVNAETSPGDIDHNGAVDVSDLLAVITTWGACPMPCPPACAADVSPPGGNCAVDVNDLLTIIVNWG